MNGTNQTPSRDWETVVKNVVFKYVDPKETTIFLFGSRAEGTERRASDYDVGFFGPQKISFRIFSQIRDELDQTSFPYDIDFVDFSTAAEDFRKIALKTIKLWSNPTNGFNQK